MRLNTKFLIVVFFLSALCPSLMLSQTRKAQQPSTRFTNTASPRPHRNLDAAEIDDLLRRFHVDIAESPTAVQCAVLNNNGQRVTSIPTTEIGDPSFFLKYASGGVFAQQVTFMTVPLFEGSPLTKQAQVFDLPNPDDLRFERRRPVERPARIDDWEADRSRVDANLYRRVSRRVRRAPAGRLQRRRLFPVA